MDAELYLKSHWADSLPLMNQNPWLFDRHQCLTQFIDTDAYGWHCDASPPSFKQIAVGPLTNMNAFETFKQELIVVPGSFLTGIGAFCSDTAGFRFNVYEESTKRNIAGFSGEYVHSDLGGGNVGLADVLDGTLGASIPNVLQSPLVVGDKGKVQIEIVSLATVPAFVQVALFWAVPLRKAD